MENLVKWFIGLAFIVLLVFLSYRVYDRANSEEDMQLSEQVAEVKRGNDRLEARNKLLMLRIEALRTDPGAIERKVRDELGLVRPDEVLILLEEEE